MTAFTDVHYTKGPSTWVATPGSIHFSSYLQLDQNKAFDCILRGHQLLCWHVNPGKFEVHMYLGGWLRGSRGCSICLWCLCR